MFDDDGGDDNDDDEDGYDDVDDTDEVGSSMLRIMNHLGWVKYAPHNESFRLGLSNLLYKTVVISDVSAYQGPCFYLSLMTSLHYTTAPVIFTQHLNIMLDDYIHENANISYVMLYTCMYICIYVQL